MAIREHSIFDCILSNSQNTGGETALVSGELRLTFAELPLHVNCLARDLVKQDLKKETGLLFCLITAPNMFCFLQPVRVSV